MEFLVKRALYYTFALKECVSSIDTLSILRKIAPLFFCEDLVGDDVKNALKSDTLQNRLISARMIEYYQSYLEFSQDLKAFGKCELEKELLNLKKSGLLLADCESDDSNNRKGKEAAVLYGLLLYLNGKPREVYLPVFREIAEDDFDAVIALAFLDELQGDRYLRKLKREFLALSTSTCEYLEAKIIAKKNTSGGF